MWLCTVGPIAAESLEGELECGALCGKSSKAQPPCNHTGCRSESGDADARRGSGPTGQCGWPRWLRDDVGACTGQAVLGVSGRRQRSGAQSATRHYAVPCSEMLLLDKSTAVSEEFFPVSTQVAAAD